MDFGFLSSQYPANDYTNSNNVLVSLGSFWTQVFQEQGTLRGYTLGMAEELIQSYITLVETLNSYSIKDIPVFATTKWQPIIIKKSQFSQVPFKFQTNSAVFGAQPGSDRFYAGKVFQFGKPESPTANVYSATPSVPLRKFSVIADRIISPSFIAVNGVHVTTDQAYNLYFNSDIFNNSNIPRASIISDNGSPSTYTNAEGDVVNDELMILWCYNAENDAEYIYDNFGRLFEFKLPSSEVYKGMLEAIFNLFVSGATVNAIKSIMAAFNGITPVKNTVETIQEIYRDNLFQYVVTDKEVYRFQTYQQLVSINAGDQVYGGDILINAVEYYDAVVSNDWWKSAISTPKLGLSSQIFLGNYKHQLFFSTTAELVTLSLDGNINFPVLGEPADVEEFNRQLNHPENKQAAIVALGLKNPGSAVVINPVDFLFNNFFKNNTALLKFNFYSEEELATFFSYFPMMKQYLPSHVYVLLYVNLNIPSEEYARMNSRYSLPNFPNTPLSIDGSSSNGLRIQAYPTDPDYYKNYRDRLFCISESPKASDNNPLFYTENLDQLTIGEPNIGQFFNINVGKIFTDIPISNPPPTNRDVPTILFIDFNSSPGEIISVTPL
jgi:hypothetical protein